MSDKQDRYAHVRILENTPARTVIHFRYGQCEAENYVCANPDPATGWTDWADDVASRDVLADPASLDAYIALSAQRRSA